MQDAEYAVQPLEHYGRDDGALSVNDVTVATDGTAYFTNIIHGTDLTGPTEPRQVTN